MVATFVGRSEWTDVRVGVARRLGIEVLEMPEPSGSDMAVLPSGGDGVAFLTGPADRAVRGADAAIRRMVHVFFDLSRVPSHHDSGMLIGRAREAGVQLSYSRPLWFDAGVQDILDQGPPSVLSMSAGLDSEINRWQSSLHTAADLCGALCGTFATRRIDAEVARGTGRTPLMVLLALRFLNGALAHVRLGPGEEIADRCRILAGTESGLRDVLVQPARELVAMETEHFLTAIMSGKPGPVQLRTAVDAAMMVEKIFARLRE